MVGVQVILKSLKKILFCISQAETKHLVNQKFKSLEVLSARPDAICL